MKTPTITMTAIGAPLKSLYSRATVTAQFIKIDFDRRPIGALILRAWPGDGRWILPEPDGRASPSPAC
jgi:hypothetical protein